MASNLQELIPAFFTGPNGQRLTPEQIAQRQQVAQSLLGRATDTSPDAGGWASVLTKGLLGYKSGADNRAADNAIAKNAEASQQSIAAMLGGLTGGVAYPQAVAAGQSPTSAVATNSIVPMAESNSSSVSIPSAPEIRQGLIDRGLQPHIADAFILNFQDESGLNPGINEQNPTVPGSRGGFGLYQLTGPRRREYEAFAAQRGVDPADTNAQLDFLIKEGSGSEKAAFDKILASPDTASAAQAIVNNFLRPAEQHRAARSAKYGRVANTPQEAIEVVAPLAAPEVAPYNFAVDANLSVAPNVPMQEGGDSFNDRWNAGVVSPVQEVAAPVAETVAPAVSPAQANLLAQNDMMLGGALSPTGTSPVAQALSGYFPDAPTAQQQTQQGIGGINPAVIQALSDPYASPEQRQIASMLLGRQLDAGDPYKQAELQLKQAQTQAALRKANNPNADETYFGNPIAIQNADGTISYGQIGNQGSFKPIQLGEGQTFAPPTKTIDTGTEVIMTDQAGNVISRTPKMNREAAAETAGGQVEGKTEAEKRLAAPGDIQAAQTALDVLDQIEKHPGLDIGTGIMSVGNSIPGTPGYDFQNLVKQASSGAFLSAIQQMRGMGALSNSEGAAATAAVNRMDTATSKEGFLAAVRDYRKIVEAGRDRANKSMGSSASADTGGFKIRSVR